MSIDVWRRIPGSALRYPHSNNAMKTLKNLAYIAVVVLAVLAF
jgi:hypothetical protein